MSIPEHTQAYSLKGCLTIFALIMLGIVVLVVGATLGFDQACVSAGETWLPGYPGAELVEERYSFLRMFGAGTSRRVLYTPDDELTVRRWYQESDNANSANNASRGGASFRVQLQEAAGGGTNIIMHFECAKELDLSPFGIGRGGGS